MNRGEAAVQLNSLGPSTSNHGRPLWNWPALKISEKLWAEVSESSCLEKNIDLIGYNSYSQNFLKIYSRRLHQIVHREKIYFFFKKCLNLKSYRQLERFLKSTLKDTKSGATKSASHCDYFNDVGDRIYILVTLCHWHLLDALIEILSMLVSFVTNIDVVNVKQGCVFPMVIWPAFRIGQYRVNDLPYHAPQFTFDFWLSPFKAGEAIGQTIVCMDDSFEVHEWCLFNSDILLSFFEGILFRIRIFSLKWTVMGESGQISNQKT